MVDRPLFQQQGVNTKNFSASEISNLTAKAMQDVLLHKVMTQQMSSAMMTDR